MAGAPVKEHAGMPVRIASILFTGVPAFPLTVC
jgi:hypothetical protein